MPNGAPSLHTPLAAGTRCAVIVAHPDDETLWAGGFLRMNPLADWTVVSLCRGSDPDRADRFFRACDGYGAKGIIGDLDDGPEQTPLGDSLVQDSLAQLLLSTRFDIVLTHSPRGEYTRHLRHEEVSRAVRALRQSGRLRSRLEMRFAYEDGNAQYLPRAERGADIRVTLPEDVWEAKYRTITQLYGFAPDSWEARTTPRREAFWLAPAPEVPDQPVRRREE